MPVIKYFKSATFNSLISQKTERILKLIILPVWGIAIVATILLLIQVGYSTNLYFKSVDLKNKYQGILTRNKQDEEIQKRLRPQSFNPSEIDVSGVDLKLFREVGINDPNPNNDEMPNEAIAINSDGIKTGIFYILIINCLVFLLPWLLIRGFYWIKLADATPL